MNFFAKKARSPADLVRSLKDGLMKLDQAGAGEGRKRVRRRRCPGRTGLSSMFLTDVAFERLTDPFIL